MKGRFSWSLLGCVVLVCISSLCRADSIIESLKPRQVIADERTDAVVAELVEAGALGPQEVMRVPDAPWPLEAERLTDGRLRLRISGGEPGRVTTSDKFYKKDPSGKWVLEESRLVGPGVIRTSPAQSTEP